MLQWAGCPLCSGMRLQLVSSDGVCLVGRGGGGAWLAGLAADTQLHHLALSVPFHSLVVLEFVKSLADFNTLKRSDGANLKSCLSAWRLTGAERDVAQLTEEVMQLYSLLGIMPYSQDPKVKSEFRTDAGDEIEDVSLGSEEEGNLGKILERVSEEVESSLRIVESHSLGTGKPTEAANSNTSDTDPSAEERLAAGRSDPQLELDTADLDYDAIENQRQINGGAASYGKQESSTPSKDDESDDTPTVESEGRDRSDFDEAKGVGDNSIIRISFVSHKSVSAMVDFRRTKNNKRRRGRPLGNIKKIPTV